MIPCPSAGPVKAALCRVRLVPLVAVEVGVAEDEDEDVVVFPRVVPANAQTWRTLFTSEGRSGVSSTSVWLVARKLSARASVSP